MATRRTETRAVRPFIGLLRYDDALDGVGLVVSGERVDGSTVLTPSALLESTVELDLTLDGRSLATAHDDAQLKSADVQLLVFAKSKTLKQTAVLVNEPADALAGQQLTIDRSAYPLLFDDVSGGFAVVIALILARTREHQPLRPYLKGTWLARRDFTVTVERDDMLFVPVPLDEARRKELRLPPKTMSYVHFSDDVSPLTTTSLDELLEFLVDDSVLGHMKASERSPEARLVMTQLATELLTAVLQRGARDLDDDDVQLQLEDVGTKSVFHRILAKVSQTRGDVTEDAIVAWAKSDPDRISAVVENAVSLQTETLSMLAGTT